MLPLTPKRVVHAYTEHIDPPTPDRAREVHSLTFEEYVTSQLRGMNTQVAVLCGIQGLTLLLVMFILIFMLMGEAHASIVEVPPLRIDTPCVIYKQIPKPPPMLTGSATVYTEADKLIDCGEYYLAVRDVVPGDVSGDGKVDAVDIQGVINLAL